MKTSIEDFKTGWYGARIHLGEEEIDKLIKYLQMLKKDKTYHFHMFSTAFDSELGGIADIEFSRSSDSEGSNMDIGA